MAATTLGYVTRTDTGADPGAAWPGSTTTDIDAAPVSGKTSPAHPGCQVKHAGVEVGAGWVSIHQTTGKPYVRLLVAHPDISLRAIKMNWDAPPARMTTTSSS